MDKFQIIIPHELYDLAPNYLANRIRDIALLKDALTRKDLEFISTLCHKTKGTAGGYGFAEVSQMAKRLENAAKSGDLELLAAEIEAMDDYLRNIEIIQAKS